MAFAISMICWSAIDRPSVMRSGSSATPSRVKICVASSRIARRSMRPMRLVGWRPMKMFSVTDRSGKSVGSW